MQLTFPACRNQSVVDLWLLYARNGKEIFHFQTSLLLWANTPYVRTFLIINAVAGTWSNILPLFSSQRIPEPDLSSVGQCFNTNCKKKLYIVVYSTTFQESEWLNHKLREKLIRALVMQNTDRTCTACMQNGILRAGYFRRARSSWADFCNEY